LFDLEAAQTAALPPCRIKHDAIDRRVVDDTEAGIRGFVVVKFCGPKTLSICGSELGGVAKSGVGDFPVGVGRTNLRGQIPSYSGLTKRM
jgi:hypothetical protein